MRDRIVLVLLIGTVLIAVGWFGGSFVGFVVGSAIFLIVSLIVETPIGVWLFWTVGSLLGAVLGLTAAAAYARYLYRRRSN
jgi:hypothetical protein